MAVIPETNTLGIRENRRRTTAAHVRMPWSFTLRCKQAGSFIINFMFTLLSCFINFLTPRNFKHLCLIFKNTSATKYGYMGNTCWAELPKSCQTSHPAVLHLVYVVPCDPVAETNDFTSAAWSAWHILISWFRILKESTSQRCNWGLMAKIGLEIICYLCSLWR